tara:strand:+ start:313 stop:768 length:456 start_codon:yes stop_codon:yes gene_type:complete
MATHKQFREWLDRAGIVFVDPGLDFDSTDSAPGYFTLTDDMRHVRDLNRSKDKKMCLIWHDGQRCRVIEGVSKYSISEDSMDWTFQDKYGTPYRISSWWMPEHKKMRQRFIEQRDPMSGKAVSRLAYIYQGKEPSLAIMTPVELWSEESAP